jgi:hypothetical protein
VGVRSWFSRVFGSGAEDESAEVEEYHLPDQGAEDLREHPEPSLFGGVEPPSEGEFEAPPDLAP